MTPDHLHGVIAMAAMKRGKHVIVHKPIANRLKEAARVIDTARATGVATHFMPWDSNGIDGAGDGLDPRRRDRHAARGPQLDQPPRVAAIRHASPPIRRRCPKASIGTSGWAPKRERPYHPNYTHMVFRGWYDFGGGSMADMGHYSLWTVFNALELSGPTSDRADAQPRLRVRPTVSHRAVKNDFSFPAASVVRFKYPARGAAAGRSI